ncbi:MAG: HEAT repeat domain-containing protein [Candidatus Lokiarchaeota archaeon]|nr:HEAT repeat domain-containing protein [Candidatus Lokiarchaeota archaeon]
MSYDKNKNFNELIKKLFHDDKWKNRAEAARQLGNLKDGRAVNLICRALNKEEDYIVINHLIEALGIIGNPKATQDLIKIFNQEIKKPLDKYRLELIINSFISIKDKRCLPYISILLTSEHQVLKILAEKAFNVIIPNWNEYITEKENNSSFKKDFNSKL